MATTQNNYTGNGSNKLFSITFPYLDTADIDVYLNGTLQTVTTQYFFANATTVEFVTAPGAGVTVLLKRSTDEATISNNFFPGSSIKAADLNDNFDQVLFLAQETNNNVANAVAGQIPDGTITSAKILDGTIVDADVNASAGIVATKLAFTQAGTGATARTVDSKLKDVVSVKDFGAVGDGTTNDTAAIQAAINAAYADKKELYIPGGNYSVTTLNVQPTLEQGLTIRGASPYSAKIFKRDSSTSPLFNIVGADGVTNNGVATRFLFEGFGIFGFSKTAGCYGMKIDTLATFTISNMVMQSFDQALRSQGALVFSVNDCTINGNNIGFVATNSPVFTGFSNLIKFKNCRFMGHTTYAALLEKGASIVFDHTDFEGNTVSIKTNSTYEDEATYSNLIIKNCWFEANTSDCLIHDGSTTWISVKDTNFYGPGTTALTINGSNNRVNISSSFGTENLNMTDSTGYITVEQSLFPSYSISTPNQQIRQLSNSSGTIVSKINSLNAAVVPSGFNAAAVGSGTVVTSSAGTPVNLITIPTNGIYQIYCFIANSGAGYHGSVTAFNDGVVSSLLDSNSGGGVTFSLSGNTVKIAQNTGATQIMTYRWVNIM